MIRARSLCAGYAGKNVLEGLNFAIGAGQFVGILGPNACGKSTLAKVLSGVLKPSSGEVEICGLDPASCSPSELARLVAMVPQATRIPFPFSGDEIVAMGRYAHAGRFAPFSAADSQAVLRAMTLTDTLQLARRPVTEVSGGERQRLILARALAQEPKVLILDEATASMDVHRAIDAFDLLSGLNKSGLTILAILHDLNLAALYCDRLLLMKEGRIVGDGPTSEVFTKELLETVYETPMELFTHPATSRPHAVFLKRSVNPPC